MKLKRLKAGHDQELWGFVENNKPKTLRVVRYSEDGYGETCCIEVTEPKEGFFHKPRKIAMVEDDAIELFSPEWYSDFEDICRKYEEVTGKEITLKYWEA